MEIELKRNQPFTGGYTAGRLFIDGEFAMYTLEDEVREVEGEPVAEWKIKGETAIPRGRYRVILTRSPKFGRILPEVLNVPGYYAIRMHAGNRVTDTEGCILMGLDDGNPQDGWLGNSRKAEGILLARLNEAINFGQQIWLTVG